MSNQSTEVIRRVCAKMSDKLTSDQLTLLEANLIIALQGMTVEQECTALAPVEHDWDYYLSRFRATKRLKNCAESTIRQYEYTISKFREYVPKAPQEVQTDDIKYFLAMFGEHCGSTTKKPISKTYLNNQKNNLASFFSWMADEGYIGKDPVRAVPKIKIPKTIKKAYTGADMEKMKSAGSPKKRDLALIYFLDSTGLRVSEAISVNREQIRWDTRSIVIYGSKGKAEREVYMTEECAYRLQDYLDSRSDDDPALFVKEKAPHTRLSKTGAEYVVRELGRAAGVHAYPHRFRRTMITRCNRRGMPLQEIQTIAGHANPATTQIYIDMDHDTVKSSFDRCN